MSRILLGIHAHIRYDGYLEKEKKEAEKLLTYKKLKIPSILFEKKISGLRLEIQQKLALHKPEDIAQAQLISGMTPAAISILIFQIKIIEKRKLNEKNKLNYSNIN